MHICSRPSSNRPRPTPLADVLRQLSVAAGTQVITDIAALNQPILKQPIWVLGDRALVDAVLDHPECDDVHVIEIVRSDNGFWIDPSHIASSPLPYFNRKYLGRIAEVAVSTPPRNMVLEHNNVRLSSVAIVRFHMTRGDNAGFFHTRWDSLFPATATTHAVVVPDFDDLRGDADYIIEGKPELVAGRLKQAREELRAVDKQYQRKTVVGVQARVSAPASDFEQLFSRDVTACKVGANYSAGVTMYMSDGFWSELHPLLADSIWRGQIVHESPKWLTIGCHDQDDLEQVLEDLRLWREESSISRDIWYRRWELETRAADGTYLVSTCHGFIRSRPDAIVAHDVDIRVPRQAIISYLKLAHLDAEVTLSGPRNSRSLELRGDVASLRGQRLTLRWRGTDYDFHFNVDLAHAHDLAAQDNDFQVLPFPATSQTDQDRTADTAQPPGSDLRKRPLSPAPSYQVGDVVRVPLIPAQTVPPSSGVPLDWISEPTEPIRLLEYGALPERGACWKGIRLKDEFRIADVQVQARPCELNGYQYLQLAHEHAPLALLNKRKKSKHISTSGLGDSALAATQAQADAEATRWTTEIKKAMHSNLTIYVTTPLSPSTSSTLDGSNQTPDGNNQSGNNTETPQRRGIGTSASKSRAVQGIYASSTHPQKRLGGRDTFNLSMAVRVSETEVQAERMAHYGGGKHGVQVAQDRLSRAVAQATTSAKSRKYDDMADPASDDAGNTTTK